MPDDKSAEFEIKYRSKPMMRGESPSVLLISNKIKVGT